MDGICLTLDKVVIVLRILKISFVEGDKNEKKIRKVINGNRSMCITRG